MQLLLASVRASLIGIAVAFAACALFAVLSSFSLSNERLAEVVRTAVAKNDLNWAARTNEDLFTDCALLVMQHLRQGGALRRALDTKFLMRADEHPCDTLRSLVLGTAKEKATLPAAVSYFNYPFGSRHLEAFVLSALDYREAAQLYRILSYASVALLFFFMLRRAPDTALLFVPIPLFLIGAFSMHRLGGNLGHAPGYFIGFVALAIVIGRPAWFNQLPARLAFVGVLGVIAAYFDILDGVIPTLLALTILLNHFFYVSRERERSDYLLHAAAQGVAIFACFLSAYLAVTLSRFGLLWLNGVDVSAFTASLAKRTSEDFGFKLSFGTNMDALFAVRHQMTPGGASVANWFFLAGIAGWVFVGLAGVVTLVLRRRLHGPSTVDVLILVGVSLGILAWYWLFAAHTFIHVLLMVRLLAIPLACGLVAALLVLREARREQLPVRVLAILLCVAVPLAALTLHRKWTAGTMPDKVQARFVDARADLVSCSPLGLRPDGQPDGIVEMRFEKLTPPLSYVGLKGRDEARIQLVRRDPTGVHGTDWRNYILGIAREPGGALLNRRDGGFSFTAGGEQHVYAHFCRDGADSAQSRYELKVDGVTVPLKGD